MFSIIAKCIYNFFHFDFDNWTKEAAFLFFIALGSEIHPAFLLIKNGIYIVFFVTELYIKLCQIKFGCRRMQCYYYTMILELDRLCNMSEKEKKRKIISIKM